MNRVVDCQFFYIDIEPTNYGMALVFGDGYGSAKTASCRRFTEPGQVDTLIAELIKVRCARWSRLPVRLGETTHDAQDKESVSEIL